MRLIITCLRKDGRCRSLTNASPEEHACMALTVWCDATKRLGEKWKVSPYDAAKKIIQTVQTTPLERSDEE